MDSREEAAEYWRAHNGLRLRFSRALRSLVPASAGLKVFAGGAGVVLIAGVAAAAVIALQQPGESIPAAASSATATPDQTVTPVTPQPSVPGPPSTAPLTTAADIKLSAPSPSVVWARVDRHLLFRSVDRGTTWAEQELPDSGSAPIGVPQFTDGQNGWSLQVSSPATQCQAQFVDSLWRTNDGGGTWAKLAPTGIGARQCKDPPTFIDAMHGFIAAWDPNTPATIYRTSDAGNSWTASDALPDPPGEKTGGGGNTLRPYNIALRGGILLLAAGGWQHTYVYRSTDGGTTWSYAGTVPSANDVAQVAFLDATLWWASSDQAGNLITRDAGQTWQPAPASPAFDIATDGSTHAHTPLPAPQVIFADAQTGYATTDGEIQRTLDGGRHWSDLHTLTDR